MSTTPKNDKPVRPPATDGVYPRCVWCNGENYGPAVIAYTDILPPLKQMGLHGRTASMRCRLGRARLPLQSSLFRLQLNDAW